MSKDLLNKKCIPCEEKNTKPFDKDQAEDYLKELQNWTLAKDGKSIFKEYKFKDFIGAITFVDRVADVAETEGHHPDIHVYYNRAVMELSTHSIGGLSENDFIVAARIDAECNW